MIAPWVKEELADIDLGDLRLNKRVKKVVSALGSRPNMSIPAACGGWAETKAAYRFFDNKDVTFEKVTTRALPWPKLSQSFRLKKKPS